MELTGLPAGAGLVSVLLHSPHRHSTGKDRLHLTKHPKAWPDSRLHEVTTSTETANYAYLTDSDAIQSITFKSGSTTLLATTRSYDTSDRLDGVTHTYNTSQFQSFGVSEFDSMNRRKKITREDNTRWNYGYNDKGEVISGTREKTAPPNTPVPGWTHAYSFDEIGNRKTVTTNGRVSIYTPNPLNQIDNRTVPRAFDVIGKASTAAAVTVAGTPASRLDEYFYKALTTTSTGKIHIPYTVAATDANGTTTREGGKFLSATPETFGYDFDGNLIFDGRFTYTWDAENRLIAMETAATVPLPARRKLAFSYDAMNRRISKTVWHGTSSGGWQLHHKFDFIHQLGGWNILAERSGGSSNSFLRTYSWGTDLSGDLSGAGGIGGLLFTKLYTSGKTFANGMDLNGNVTLLVNVATGQSAATYDYGPFGEPIRQSGEYAALNPFRWSTKYTDDESGSVDYGLRYYMPPAGRWLNKDPIGEKGGVNLYGFVGNDGVDRWDILGQYATKQEAIDAAKDAAGSAAAKSRKEGISQAKTSLAPPRITGPGDITGADFALFDGPHYVGIAGVEYQSTVYCQKGEFDFTDPAKGSLPSKSEFKSGVLGKSNVSSWPEGSSVVAFIHTHTMARIQVTSDGEQQNLDSVNPPPSDLDIANASYNSNAEYYIIHETPFGYVLVKY